MTVEIDGVNNTVKTNTVDKTSGSTLTIGGSGTTVNIAGTAGTGFPAGTTLTGSTNNQVTTITGANAITGETNLIYDQTRLGVGANGSSADLGVGLHIKTADSGASVNSDADQLVIEGSTGGTGMSILSATNGSGDIYFGDSGNNAAGFIQYNHSSNYMRFGTNAATERMRIDTSGNVGIGTTAPDTSSYFGKILHLAGSSNVGIMFNRTDSTAAKWSIGCNSSANLDFVKEGAVKMRIASDGDVSIGTTANEAKLDLRNSANVVTMQANNTATSGIDKSTLVVQCDQDTSNSSYLLQQCRNGGGLVFKILDSGNVQNTNNSYGSTSDERIKQDISDASSQWEDIKALKIRKFKKKKDVNRDGADNTPYHLGVVAQELEASGMNGLVEEGKPQKEDVALHSDFGSIDSEGNFTEGQKIKEVKYSVLYMKSVKALQEAMAKIESLEARVKTLENA